MYNLYALIQQQNKTKKRANYVFSFWGSNETLVESSRHIVKMPHLHKNYFGCKTFEFAQQTLLVSHVIMCLHKVL